MKPGLSQCLSFPRRDAQSGKRRRRRGINQDDSRQNRPTKKREIEELWIITRIENIWYSSYLDVSAEKRRNRGSMETRSLPFSSDFNGQRTHEHTSDYVVVVAVFCRLLIDHQRARRIEHFFFYLSFSFFCICRWTVNWTENAMKQRKRTRANEWTSAVVSVQGQLIDPVRLGITMRLK